MRFGSQPIEEHAEVPLADEGRFEALVRQAGRRHAPARPRAAAGNACYVVSVHHPGEEATAQAKLAEICGLVRAQGDRIVGRRCLRLGAIDPRTYVGRGRGAALAERALDSGADMLVLDAELSPSQLRNLEDAAGVAVCDREAVILNVFLRHARTRSARIQVEVAQLEYLRPRIRGLGLDMDQQAGGMMRARGPGETASELLARQLDRRLADLRRALRKLEQAGVTQRRRRARCDRIALVGYTNAGKTSLMNALTDAGLSARDRPFETLDTTSRRLTRRGGDVLVSDTVGFIRRLPERLLSSFASTLAEIREASLLALVVDLSDVEWQRHLSIAEEVLDGLDAKHVPRHYIFNKLDKLVVPPTAARLERVTGSHRYTALSAGDGDAVAALRHTLLAEVRRQRQVARVFVAYGSRALLSLVHTRCRVLATETKAHGLRITVEAEAPVIAMIRRKGQRRARAAGHGRVR